ncbi:taste receptor type 2 member 40-like [Mantella aurantiaca]
MSPDWIAITVLTLLGSLMAFILNISIILANSWRQGQKWNHSDLIHLIMGLVNIIFQCSLTGQCVVFVFFLQVLLLREVYRPATYITMSLMYCSYWLSAWLCIYYCISITNLSHRVFAQVKKTFSIYLPHLLLLSMVVSFIITLPIIWTVRVMINQSLGNGSYDSAVTSASFSFNFPYIQAANFLGCCFPFLLTLISVGVTVSSLLKHMWKVKQHDSGFDGSKFRAHIHAISTMILFLTLFIIFYVDESLFFMMDLSTKGPMTVTGWIIFTSFPLAESIIIIQASAKLRRFLFGKILNRS